MFKKLDKFHFILLALVLVAVAYNFIPTSSEREIRSVASKVIETVTADEDLNDENSTSISIAQGDTLSKLLSEAGINPSDSYKISESINKVFPVAQLQVGQKIYIKFNDDHLHTNALHAQPVKLKIATRNQRVDVEYLAESQSYDAKLTDIPLEKNIKFVAGVVNNSLYGAAKEAGADGNTIMELINLYSYDLDFQRDVRPGDSFRIFYEYHTDPEGKQIRDPKILYASMTVHGDAKEIYRFETPSGRTDYYDSKGRSIRRTLLKTPINGARISSGYGMRHHPVLGYSRMHRGLDYAAPTGTPIYAAGDGVVQFAKSAKGYGKHVKIRHNSTYSTLYGHMSRYGKGIGLGTKVEQGQVIGYVGATGMASGPHLHYEVIVGGVKKNPAKVVFPKVPPLKGQMLAEFKKSMISVDKLVADLETNKPIRIAQR